MINHEEIDSIRLLSIISDIVNECGGDPMPDEKRAMEYAIGKFYKDYILKGAEPEPKVTGLPKYDDVCYCSYTDAPCYPCGFNSDGLCIHPKRFEDHEEADWDLVEDMQCGHLCCDWWLTDECDLDEERMIKAYGTKAILDHPEILHDYPKSTKEPEEKENSDSATIQDLQVLIDMKADSPEENTYSDKGKELTKCPNAKVHEQLLRHEHPDCVYCTSKGYLPDPPKESQTDKIKPCFKCGKFDDCKCWIYTVDDKGKEQYPFIDKDTLDFHIQNKKDELSSLTQGALPPSEWTKGFEKGIEWTRDEVKANTFNEQGKELQGKEVQKVCPICENRNSVIRNDSYYCRTCGATFGGTTLSKIGQTERERWIPEQKLEEDSKDVSCEPPTPELSEQGKEQNFFDSNHKPAICDKCKKEFNGWIYEECPECNAEQELKDKEVVVSDSEGKRSDKGGE